MEGLSLDSLKSSNLHPPSQIKLNIFNMLLILKECAKAHQIFVILWLQGRCVIRQYFLRASHSPVSLISSIIVYLSITQREFTNSNVMIPNIPGRFLMSFVTESNWKNQKMS